MKFMLHVNMCLNEVLSQFRSFVPYCKQDARDYDYLRLLKGITIEYTQQFHYTKFVVRKTLLQNIGR